MSPTDGFENRDNVYELASNALKRAQEEIRQWRIRAEDAEKDLASVSDRASLRRKTETHLRRITGVQDQIIEDKDLALAAYKNMIKDLQGSGVVGRQSEEIVTLQAKLKYVLSFVPRGDRETFAFPDGDEADYGSESQYTEAQLNYLCQALPLAMSCINRLRGMIESSGEDKRELIDACKYSLERLHERMQVGDEVCHITGKMRERKIWLQENEND